MTRSRNREKDQSSSRKLLDGHLTTEPIISNLQPRTGKSEISNDVFIDIRESYLAETALKMVQEVIMLQEKVANVAQVPPSAVVPNKYVMFVTAPVSHEAMSP